MVLEISLNILSHQTENLGKFFVNGYAHERCFNAVQIRMIFLSMIVISANDIRFRGQHIIALIFWCLYLVIYSAKFDNKS